MNIGLLFWQYGGWFCLVVGVIGFVLYAIDGWRASHHRGGTVMKLVVLAWTAAYLFTAVLFGGFSSIADRYPDLVQR